MPVRKVPLATAVNRSLDAQTFQPEDEALVQLVKHYASAIDKDPEALKKLGPSLLDALAEMGLTPKARSALVRGMVKPDGDSDKITELRSRRTNRAAHLVEAQP